MKNLSSWVVLALLAGTLVTGLACAVLAEEHEGGKEKMPADHAQKVIEVLAKVKVSLADACTAAEKKTGGKAMEAELEIEDDELSYEILVAVVAGKKLTYREVDIDAVSGKVTEDEEVEADDEDGHDDEDADDDEDDDDDHDHDDDHDEKGEEAK